MKHIIYTAFILLLASSCSKPAPSPETEKEQYGRYIFFSQQVGTKADLIESAAAMDQFGVVGFKYEGTWEDKKASLTPNVFYDDNGNLVNTETLTCNDDGTADYAPLQGWSSFKNYSFFAYYPLGHSAVTLVSTTGSAYAGGVPAIKYSNPDLNKDLMVDVMTAQFQKDMYWKSADANNLTNGDVTFTFDHCLSALGVNVKNTSSGTVSLSDVTLNLSNVSYKDIVIPLDDSPATSTAASSTSKSISLSLADGEKSLAKDDVKLLSDKLLLIPQTADMSVVVVITYKREAVGGYDGYGADMTLTLPALETALTKGQQHIVNLNFTDSTVEVQGTGSWVEEDRVEDTFN